MTIPAERSLVSPVRLAAGGVASVAGCSVDEIEDVKLVTGEVLLVLIEQGAGQPLTITLSHDHGSVTITGRTAATRFDPQHAALALCRRVLEQLCRRHSIELAGGLLRIDAVYAIHSQASSHEGRERVG